MKPIGEFYKLAEYEISKGLTSIDANDLASIYEKKKASKAATNEASKSEISTPILKIKKLT